MILDLKDAFILHSSDYFEIVCREDNGSTEEIYVHEEVQDLDSDEGIEVSGGLVGEYE